MDRGPQLPKKTYRANVSEKIAYLISYPTLVGLIILLTWQMIHDNESLFQGVFHVFAIGGCIFALYVCLIDWNARLEISPEGVSYYRCGFRIYTPWQNIIGVARVKHPYVFPAYRSVNALVFRAPTLLNVPISEGKRQGRAVIEEHWLVLSTKPHTYNMCLPLLADNLARTDLSSHEIAFYIRQYAPQVFGETARSE